MLLLGARLSLAFLVLATLSARAQETEAIPSEDDLGMTTPVVCSSVRGYGKFREVPNAAVYRDNKLLIYYEPFGYTIERGTDGYRALLTQDVRVRRRDQKTVLLKKDEILRYEAKSKVPPLHLYLSNYISTKGLSPGEYDLEIIMHDQLGKAESVSKVIPFKIKQLRPDDPNNDSPFDTPTSPTPAKKKAAHPPKAATR
jgi:hypothetical protein